MKEGNYKLIGKEDLYFAGKIWRLRFEVPDLNYVPGQFVNIEVDGKYLRRPISICDYEDGELSLVVQVVGEGTKKIVDTPVGDSMNMLVELGNGFEIPEDAGNGTLVLIGGGVGYAPLVGLMKKIIAETDHIPLTVFGFNREADVPFYHIVELREEGYPVEYCTMTGEMGDRGNALEVAEEYIREDGYKPVHFFTCGPMPMMRAVAGAFDCDGQLSLETRMGCGFGACMGCTIQTVDGPRRICKEGPVFRKSSLISI